jgi:hypothetical protein
VIALTEWLTEKRLDGYLRERDGDGAQLFVDLIWPLVRTAHIAPHEPLGKSRCGTLSMIVVLSPEMLSWLYRNDPDSFHKGYVNVVPCVCAKGSISFPLFASNEDFSDLRLQVHEYDDKTRLVSQGLIRRLRP